MFDWLHNTRQRHNEFMDQPRIDPQVLRRSLQFIRRINSLLGYTRAILSHLENFSRSWRPGERIDIVDLATGSADIPRAILRWADERGFNVHMVAVDRHPVTARVASEGPRHPRLQVVQADVFHLPFADGSFDYAMTAMFLHHLSEAEMVHVLHGMDRLARRGILAADLLRHRRAYAWISMFTLFADPMLRHDATMSVAQALTRREVMELRQRSGLEYTRYHRHFAHRFALAGEKSPAAE